MTIQSNGNTLCFFDGYITKKEALDDYTKRLSSVAVIEDTDEGIVIKYNNGDRAIVTI